MIEFACTCVPVLGRLLWLLKRRSGKTQQAKEISKACGSARVRPQVGRSSIEFPFTC